MTDFPHWDEEEVDGFVITHLDTAISSETIFYVRKEAYDAWQARAEAAEKRVQELEAQLAAQWRPVSEPPKKDGVYLVWRGHNVEPLPGWAEISGYATRSDVWRIDYPYSDSVTHWQPLPAPPQDTPASGR